MLRFELKRRSTVRLHRGKSEFCPKSFIGVLHRMGKISEASQWHVNRARQMRKRQPELFAQFQRKQSRSYTFLIVLLFSLQLVLAYSCQFLSWVAVVALSATVGAFFAWGLHSLTHELTHNTVYLSKNKAIRQLLYKLCTLTYPDLSLFVYYRWQHMPHHSRLGGNPWTEAYLGDNTDVDVMAVSHFYKVKHTPGSQPSVKFPGLFKRGLRKLSIGLFALPEYVFNTLGFLRHIVLIPHTIRKPEEYTHRNRERLLQARISLLFHLCLVVGFFSFLTRVAGFHAFLYLLLSFLFIKGFLFHPYILFWITEHKTTEHEDYCQPTTSVYHWFTGILFWHLNYHVEHHDFPSIPGKHLPVIHQACREEYDSLFHFASIPDAYRQFFDADEAWNYGCQLPDTTEPEAPQEP